MRKTKGRAKQHKQTDLEFFQGGPIADSVVRKHVADVKRRLAAEFDEDNAIRQQAAKLSSQLTAPIYDGEQSELAIDGLRKVTERLAKRKLPKPAIHRFIPDIFGRYTLKFTPPYLGLGGVAAGQVSSVTGNPTLVATGVDSLGQMTCSVDTNFEKPSSGTASNLMGVHFKPMFKHATARISFDSQLAFSYYVNSIRNKIATARGQGLIQLFRFDNAFVQPALQRGAFIGFNEIAQNELDFNAHSAAGPTWFLEAPVSSDHFYFVVISLSCSARGEGWPGSLAGAKVMVTVPSITVTVTGEPVLQPA
jgi:hypothetical protein